MNQNQNNFPPHEQSANPFEQVDQQVAQGQPATVLVERNNDTITTAQVMGMTEGKTNVFFGDVSDGPKEGMPYKPVGNERLNDHYQQYLARKLAGEALRESGIEGAPLAAEASAESPIDKYTEAYVKAHPLDHLLDKDLTEEQQDAVIERVKGMDLRTDEQKHLDAERLAKAAMVRQQDASSFKYMQARHSGANDEVASASADRAHAKTYDELLADELKKAGLQ